MISIFLIIKMHKYLQFLICKYNRTMVFLLDRTNKKAEFFHLENLCFFVCPIRLFWLRFFDGLCYIINYPTCAMYLIFFIVFKKTCYQIFMTIFTFKCHVHFTTTFLIFLSLYLLEISNLLL